MRVLINYDYRYYPMTTASYIERALRADPRISVFRVGEDRVPCADLIINIEPCPKVISYPGRPSVYWEIDNHIHRGKDIDKYQKVDWVFITQRYFLHLYPKVITKWLPLAADPDIHKLYTDEPLNYDVGFIGNDTYQRRRGLLDLIGKNYKLLREKNIFDDNYSRHLSRCKILFNCSMDNDVNMRFFEAMSIGRLLLSDGLPCQDTIVKNGTHYVAYNEWGDLNERISYFLEHEKEREKIASAGAAYIRAKHTYKDRLEEILKVCNFY